MNSHRAILECLWPSPHIILIGSGDKKHCNKCLKSWIEGHRLKGLKEGENAFIIEIKYEYGHTVFGIDLV